MLDYAMAGRLAGGGRGGGDGSPTGVIVEYQYTLFLPHKIPIYLKIVKSMIMNN